MVRLRLESKSTMPAELEGSTVDDLPSSPPGSPQSDTSESSQDDHSAPSSYFVSREATPASSPDEPEVAEANQPDIEDDLSPPDHPYFTPEFQKIIKESKTLCSMIEDRLRDTQDANLKPLVQIASNISKPSTTTRTIAFLGDSGVGKSTLLNSLLDCEIAPEGNSGCSVTSFATEFRYLDGKDTGFKLEVEYQTEVEIQETVREYVWNYQSLQLPGINDTKTPDEFQEMETKAKIAEDALRVIFGHRSDLFEVCKRRDEQSYEIAVAEVLQWLKDVQWPAGIEDGKYNYHTDDPEDCSDVLSSFNSDEFWPFLKAARIYLKSPLLQHGVVLVDLPGLRDCNAARVKATQEYLAKVDHVFIVTDIKRAASNESVRTSLFTVMKRNFPNEWETSDIAECRSFTIVCTHSENMNIKKTEREFKRLKLISAEELENFEIEEEKAPTHEKEKWKMQRLYFLMQARNTSVTSRIQQAYFQQRHRKGLNVFCVSNEEYCKGRDAGDNLRMVVSQIPSLRKHCLRAIADHRLAEAQNLLISVLPGLLQSIKLYTAPKPSIDEEFANALTATDAGFLRFQDSMKEEFDRMAQVSYSCLTALKVLSLEKSADWAGAANEVHDQIARTYNHSTYDAYIRHNGTHSTAARRNQRWNNDMTAQMRQDLSLYWQRTEHLISNYFHTLSTIMRERMEELKFNSRALSDFSRLVQLLVPSVELDLEQARRIAGKQIECIRGKALEDNEASFMYAAMLPAYRDAAGMKGQGRSVLQIARMRDQINEPLFKGIVRAIHDALEEVLKDITQEIEEVRSDCVDKLEDDLKALRRRITYTISPKTEKDYSAIRNSLVEWEKESKKGVTLAKKIQASMERALVKT